MNRYQFIALFWFIPCLGFAQSLSSWSGVWTFDECWPDGSGTTSNCISYKLTIPKDSTKHALLDMEGFQTDNHTQVILRPAKNGVDILSSDTKEKLFGLSKKQGTVKTKWFSLTPARNDNQKEGHYFTKKK